MSYANPRAKYVEDSLASMVAHAQKRVSPSNVAAQYEYNYLARVLQVVRNEEEFKTYEFAYTRLVTRLRDDAYRTTKSNTSAGTRVAANKVFLLLRNV